MNSPACDKSGIFLVKLFLDDIRKIIKNLLCIIIVGFIFATQI